MLTLRATGLLVGLGPKPLAPPPRREGKAIHQWSASEPWAAAGIVGLHFHRQVLYILAADALLYSAPSGGGPPSSPFSLQVSAPTVAYSSYPPVKILR